MSTRSPQPTNSELFRNNGVCGQFVDSKKINNLKFEILFEISNY